MLEVIQVPLLSDNYSYIIIDTSSKLIGCIDPAVSEELIKVLQSNDLKLDFIFSTHHHYDHVGVNLELKEKYKCKVVGSFSDSHRIPGIDIKLKENDFFSIGDSKFRVIETPGHTVGHICFYFEKECYLFAGDTIFSLGCGRLFEGSYKQMVLSITKLKSLPKETKIFCGHEYTQSNAKFALYLDPKDSLLRKKINEIDSKISNSLSTVPSSMEEELILNPFMKFDDEKYLRRIGIKNISNVDNFKKIREMKDNF